MRSRARPQRILEHYDDLLRSAASLKRGWVLHATKPDVFADETAVARVAPVTHAHVNSLGRYDLHRQPPPARHLRPLRRLADASNRAVLTPPLGVSGDKH